MESSAPDAKLAQLRAKTDRQVTDYIRSRLQTAAAYAFKADEANRTGNAKRAAYYRQKAADAIRHARRLKRILDSGDSGS